MFISHTDVKKAFKIVFVIQTAVDKDRFPGTVAVCIFG